MLPLLLAVAVIAFDVWATRQILADEPDEMKKRLQLALVWCLPMVGALLAGFAHHRRVPEVLSDPTISDRDLGLSETSGPPVDHPS